MTAKKPTVKKPVKPKAKKEVVETVTNTNVIITPKKELNFPTIKIKTVKNFDLNWYAMSRNFKSKFKFIYDRKKKEELKTTTTEPKYLADKAVIKINYRWIYDNFNDKIKRYYECYVVIWDYYINKNKSVDINNRIREIINYGR